MRKLLIATVVAAVTVLSATLSAAASSTASYSETSHGKYNLCITNDLGLGLNIAQVQIVGLNKQPAYITVPANWSFAPVQLNGKWSARWTASDPTLGIVPGATLCGFTFTQAGRPLKALLTVNVTTFAPFSGFPTTVTTTANRTN